jgi:hypothetical protein
VKVLNEISRNFRDSRGFTRFAGENYASGYGGVACEAHKIAERFAQKRDTSVRQMQRGNVGGVIIPTEKEF